MKTVGGTLYTVYAGAVGMKTFCLHTRYGVFCGTIDHALKFKWYQGRNGESCRLLAGMQNLTVMVSEFSKNVISQTNTRAKFGKPTSAFSYLDSEHFLLFILSSLFTLQCRTHYISRKNTIPLHYSIYTMQLLSNSWK